MSAYICQASYMVADGSIRLQDTFCSAIPYECLMIEQHYSEQVKTALSQPSENRRAWTVSIVPAGQETMKGALTKNWNSKSDVSIIYCSSKAFTSHFRTHNI